MNIRIGDMVRFLTEKLEGKVTAIVDHSTVNVYVDEYGFEIPASVNDLVVIRTDFEKAPLSGQAVPGQKAVPTVSSDTIYLALVPDNFHNLTESRYDYTLSTTRNKHVCSPYLFAKTINTPESSPAIVPRIPPAPSEPTP